MGRTTNNSDDSEDDRICEIDKRIAARKAAALAEDKAANEPSQYVSNRAKMVKDQASNSPDRSRSEKVNRLQAVAKINDTFGYGGKEFKKESPPVKKPLTTEP